MGGRGCFIDNRPLLPTGKRSCAAGPGRCACDGHSGQSARCRMTGALFPLCSLKRLACVGNRQRSTRDEIFTLGEVSVLSGVNFYVLVFAVKPASPHRTGIGRSNTLGYRMGRAFWGGRRQSHDSADAANAASGLAGSLACDGRPRSHRSRMTLSAASKSADPRCQRGEPHGEVNVDKLRRITMFNIVKNIHKHVLVHDL